MPVEGTVLFYSIVDIDPTLWKGALQGHFAENDHFDTIDDVRLFLHGLEQGGVEIDAHVYKGVGHWFANPSVPVAYDEAAANEALGRTVEFFHHHLA
jgi:dienelactone hydrolase